MKSFFLHIRYIAVTIFALVIANSAFAQSSASKPIRFVVGFGPGGANDLVARIAAEGVARQLGQPVVVLNKPGAGSILGADFVAKSPPDGTTFFIGAGGTITLPMIRSSMPYAEDDLVPVALITVSPSVIVVGADSPIKSLKDLIALARQPNGVNFATAGTGSTPHFVAEMLKTKAGGGKYEIIPYRSGLDAKVAVISKQVDATSEASVVVIPQLQGGKLRALASTWTRRISAMPDVPTTRELGYPEVLIGHWAGLFAPKGTPEAVIEKMNQAIQATLRQPEVHSKLALQGIEPMPGDRAAFVRFIQDEQKRLSPIIRGANMKED